jgi:hypothetical protein
MSQVAIVRNGITRFIRILPTIGEHFTETLMTGMSLSREDAEELKREVGVAAQGTPEGDDSTAIARRILTRTADALIEEIRGSVNYYLTQAGEHSLERLVVSGNGARLPHLANRVARSLNTRVSGRVLDREGQRQMASRSCWHCSRCCRLRSDGAVGLLRRAALNRSPMWLGVCDETDQPAAPESQQRTRRRRVAIAIFGGIAYLVLLVVGMLYWDSKVATAREDLDAQSDINLSLEREVAALGDTAVMQTQYQAKADLVRSALVADIDWGIFLNDLARLVPPRVWVDTFNGSVIPQTTPGVVGQVSFSGAAPDVSAGWALESDQFAGITGPW